MGSLIVKMEIGYVLFVSVSFFSFVFADSRTYIIHMDSSAKPSAFVDHNNWYLATLSSVSNTVNLAETFDKHLYTYTISANGFSAKLTDSELEALKTHPGYVSHTRNRPLQLQTTRTPQFLGLSTSFGAWLATNYGDDVIIGLVDTGVWPESESFSDKGMTPVPSKWKGKCESSSHFNVTLCNKKLIGAYFFNKGYLTENPDAKITMNSTRDTEGHGTHTASTAAGNFVKGASYFGYANGTASGMAPHARLAIYKTVWDSTIYESDVLAAMDQAIKDGVDVLSLSLIFYKDYIFSLDEDAIAVAAFAAMKEGIFVAACAGNDGPDSYSVVNAAPWITTVGAGTIDRDFGGTLTLGNGNIIRFKSLYPGNDPQKPTTLVFLDGCFMVEMKKNKNNIIVCKDNSVLSGQVNNAYSAEVFGAVFIADFTVPDIYAETECPAAFMGLVNGQRLIEYIQNNSNPSGKFQFKKTIIGVKPAPTVHSYSARGPFPSCKYVTKPDIIAPGSSVLASWSPLDSVTEVRNKPLFSHFNLDTGTSMAIPYVAGVAALIKHAHPDWSPAAIRSALMTTANPFDNTNSQIIDTSTNSPTEATPLDIGSGHIDPNKALNPGLIYDATPQDYINLLCAMNYTKKQLQKITKFIPSCENMSLDLNYPSFIAHFPGTSASESNETLVFDFERTVINVGDAVSSYGAKLTGMEGIKVKVKPQKLTFKHKYEKQRYKLTVEGPTSLKVDVVYGSLSWVHDQGKYVVRSPIAATTLKP